MARRTVTISREVYDYIAERGRFGESVDDVLRRIFSIDAEPPSADGPPSVGRGPSTQPTRVRSAPRPRLAQRRLSARLADGFLVLAFVSGPEDRWRLPAKDAHNEIARLSIEAQAWAESNGATYGQQKAVHKALTEGGYYNTGPRR